MLLNVVKEGKGASDSSFSVLGRAMSDSPHYCQGRANLWSPSFPEQRMGRYFPEPPGAQLYECMNYCRQPAQLDFCQKPRLRGLVPPWGWAPKVLAAVRAGFQGTLGTRQTPARRWHQDEAKHSGSRWNLYCVPCL